jgi:hypothetical protein
MLVSMQRCRGRSRSISQIQRSSSRRSAQRGRRPRAAALVRQLGVGYPRRSLCRWCPSISGPPSSRFRGNSARLMSLRNGAPEVIRRSSAVWSATLQRCFDSAVQVRRRLRTCWSDQSRGPSTIRSGGVSSWATRNWAHAMLFNRSRAGFCTLM